MARLQVVLREETEKKLRETIFRVRGSWRKGYISEAVEEAVVDWIRKNSETQAKRR